MALENILRSIEERRNAELDRISSDYRQRLETLQRETETKLEALRSGYEKRTAEDCKSLENRERSNADIEARRIVRDTKSGLVEENLARAFGIMEGLGGSSSYKAVLEEMASTARRMLGKDCKISVGEGGQELLKGKNITAENVDPFGGIVAESADGTMELDLTISTLKRELKDRIMLEIAEKFGAK